MVSACDQQETAIQEECPLEIDGEQIYLVVEQNPTLIGDLSQISEAIRYPQAAKLARVEGKVFTQFIVDTGGNVECAQVVQGLGFGLDEEAIRIVSNLKFSPGLQRGEAVNVRFSLPVRFVLANAD